MFFPGGATAHPTSWNSLRGPIGKSVCAQKNTFHLHAEFKIKKRVLGNESEPSSNGVGPQKRVPPSRSEGTGADCAGISFNTAVSRVGIKLFTETTFPLPILQNLFVLFLLSLTG